MSRELHIEVHQGGLQGAGSCTRTPRLQRTLCALSLLAPLAFASVLYGQTPTPQSTPAPSPSQGGGATGPANQGAGTTPPNPNSAPVTAAPTTTQTKDEVDEAVVAAGKQASLPTTIWDWTGLQVSAIRFEGVSFDQADTLPEQLTQKSGQPLDPDKVRESTKRLFATGLYRDITVRGERSGNTVTLIFAGVPRYFIGRVTITGIKEDRLAALLQYATKLDPGTPYTDDQLVTATSGVQASLAQNGYYQPVLKVTTDRDDVNRQVNVTYAVAIGPQARVGDVSLEGQDPGFTPDQFRKKAKLKKGSRVSRETASNALDRLRGQYQKLNRLEATATLQKQTYNPPRKQLDYDFNANQGPVVTVVTNGVKFSKSRLHLLVPVFQEGAVDNDLLNEGSYNIREFLQQEGYFNATVSVKLVGEATKTQTVQYDIDKGKLHKVLDVTLKGNKYFDTETLKERMRVVKADLYQRAGRYSQSLLASDASSIEALYRANGFNTVKVETAVKEKDTDAKGKQGKYASIFVSLTITEGPQQKFGAVDIAGMDAQREKEVRALLNSQKGQPFSLTTLTGDRDAVLGYYLARGFDQARVEVKQNPEKADPKSTDVSMNVTEGPQVFVDKVLVSGAVHTKSNLINDQLMVKAGQPLDQSALVDTQRNLYNQALFNQVNAAVQNPAGDSTRKNVLVQLTEGKRWDVTYGFGFEAQTGRPPSLAGTHQGSTAAQNGKAGVSPRVSIDVSRINLRGTDESLTLHASYGLLEEVAQLTFNDPHLFGNKNFGGIISGGYSNVQNITTFSSKTLSGDFRVTQKAGRADQFIYDFQYRRVEVDPNSLEIAPNLIPLLSEPVVVGGPGVTWFHDTRSPSQLDAGKGQFTSIQEFIADSKFGSETNFNKIDASNSTYYTFGKHKYVFARNTRIGFENAFGTNPNASTVTNPNPPCSGTLLETNATCNPIPLPERLYAGGATSHRGFSINSAGPRDLSTGYPVGGSAVVVNTFELRLPPPVLPLVGSSVSFVVFHDMGNVFQHTGDMFKSIKNFKQPNEQTCRNLTIPAGQTASTAVGTCDFRYYSHAVGLGARYKTPVGPIRVDFSYNLNPPIYPVFTDFNNDAPYVGQASHFNFFFSIGQAF